jgi:hypothetical protein
MLATWGGSILILMVPDFILLPHFNIQHVDTPLRTTIQLTTTRD